MTEKMLNAIGYDIQVVPIVEKLRSKYDKL